MRYKVVRTDNFARETVAEHAEFENLNGVEAECLCEIMRAQEADDPNSPYWYVVARQDYRLWRGMEELV